MPHGERSGSDSSANAATHSQNVLLHRFRNGLRNNPQYRVADDTARKQEAGPERPAFQLSRENRCSNLLLAGKDARHPYALAGDIDAEDLVHEFGIAFANELAALS